MVQVAEIRLDPGSLGLEEIRRLALDVWSDIGFDEGVLARLKRDGLVLDDVRLRGPCPYVFDCRQGNEIRIRVEDGAPAETLFDLWRLHFIRGLRTANLAA
jgi:hypothetical protein